MRAVMFREFGGPDVLEIGEIPRPVPAGGQVLVRVAAAPVTPVDLDARSGELRTLLRERPYHVLGREAAGTVEEAGPGVTRFRAGDRVIGMVSELDADSAAQAEWVVFDEAAVAAAPASMSSEHASVIPLNGLTADQALDRLALTAGQTVLITGAAGGVGGFAVELAVQRGLTVYAMARETDRALIQQLGAHHFLMPDGPLPEGVDGVVDAAVRGEAVIGAVRDGGAFVTLVYGGEPAGSRGITVSTMWTQVDGKRLADLSAMADDGLLTPRVAQSLPMSQVAWAHERFVKGGLRGHLVLVP